MPRGKDGLYSRNKGIFCFRYKDANGAWRERSTGSVKRSEARQVKKQFLDDVEQGTVPTPAAKLSIAKAVEQWLEGYRNHISRNTVRSYKTCLKPIKDYFGSRLLQNVTVSDLHNYQNTRSDAGRHNRTINHEVLAFSFVLQEANLWEKLRRKYKPLPTKHQHSSRTPLTNEEFNTLVMAAMGDGSLEPVLYLMLVAANTTCRPCEIAGLTLGRIQLEGDYPHMTVCRKTTKTDAGERVIPLNRVSSLAIQKLVERAKKLGAFKPEHFLLPAKLAKHTRPTDPLYERRFDGIDPNDHQKGWHASWRKLREKAGLPHLEFYQLRHTSITAAGEQNVPLAVMKSLAGHMDAKMSEYYTSIRDNPKVQAVMAIESANPQLLTLLGIESSPGAKIQ